MAGTPITALKRTDEFKYLGIVFSGNGRLKYNPHTQLSRNLELVDRAPMEQQQKVFAIRTVAIPQLHHGLSMGGIHTFTRLGEY